jgi:hypothetical protein
MSRRVISAEEASPASRSGPQDTGRRNSAASGEAMIGIVDIQSIHVGPDDDESGLGEPITFRLLQPAIRALTDGTGNVDPRPAANGYISH